MPESSAVHASPLSPFTFEFSRIKFLETRKHLDHVTDVDSARTWGKDYVEQMVRYSIFLSSSPHLTHRFRESCIMRQIKKGLI